MNKEEKAAEFERLKITAKLTSSSKNLIDKFSEFEKVKTELHKCAEDMLDAINSFDSEKHKEIQNVLTDFLEII